MALSSKPKSGDWLNQYFVAALVVAATVGFFYQYAMVRYGVSGLSTLNKSLATSSLFLLGVVLLLGPFSRMFDVLDRAFKYRKEFGVLTFYISALHVYLSMFPLARRGPWGLYISRPFSAYPGLAALVIMFLLLVFSLGVMQRVLGAKLWWKVQYWGARIAFALIAIHLAVLKYSGWQPWIATRGAEIAEGMQSLPPLSLLGAVFAAFVLLVRLSELLSPRAGRVITQMASVVALGVTVWLFISSS
jgi:DMSO/TMAO reductase YedYZ heme-binding membrane subunit